MKKSFTLLELVFVVVVIGILSAVIIPSTRSDNLQEAAIQVVSHIRYTQHLAMVDDKFDTNSSSKWYKKRWQIFFSNTPGSDSQWSCTIFSDYLGTSTGNPDPKEVANNPLDRSKKLTGGYSGTKIIHYNDEESTNKLNLGHSYGVTNITFSSSCEVNSKRIAFDNLGRPVYDSHHLLDDLYRNGSNSRLLTQNCDITLSDGTENIVLRISPETGYTCILNSSNECI